MFPTQKEVVTVICPYVERTPFPTVTSFVLISFVDIPA